MPLFMKVLAPDVRDGAPASEESEVNEPPVPAPLGALRAYLAKPPRDRIAGIVLGTLVEAASIYLWLRLHLNGHPWWGLGSLILGEIVETHMFRFVIDREGLKRWGQLPPGPAGGRHFRRVQMRVDGAGYAEVAIWVLWLALAEGINQPVAAAVLLVAMHGKHHVESVTVLDTRFRDGLFSPMAILSSAMEVGGAVACLALIYDGHLTLAAVALFVGLAIEHTVLIDILYWEIKARDIRHPRDPRWRPPLRLRQPSLYAVTHFAPLWKLVHAIKPLERVFNRIAINQLVGAVEPRPNPLSTMAPYTSWTSLTDRTFSGRHLPTAKRPLAKGEPPPIDRVAALFARPEDAMIECPKSTVLFSFFAQWFTDGFLRTTRKRELDGTRDTRKNESTHEIDLAQLYGLHRDATNQLRTRHGGLLKSQTINGEEYPQYLCSGGTPKPEFEHLPVPFQFDELSVLQKDALFAMGTDTRNLGFMAFNVLFLREHNRIARRLAEANPSWDSDQLFETTRNVLTVILIKIVVEEYINHINPGHLGFRLLPGSFPNEPWHRPNWMAIEFNLLYRWHSLVPSIFHLEGTPLEIDGTLTNSAALTSAGLGQVMAAASSQPAGRIGLFNTDDFLVEHAEKPSIAQARGAELCSYNDYRRLCLLPPVREFGEITSDPTIQDRLRELYPSVDDVEFYVGLFAEEAGPDDVLPPLMLTMVAFDAFSQALTNPLFAPRVFNEQTFSAAGMKIIEETTSISDLVHRNVPERAGGYVVSLTRRDYKRV